MENGKWNIENGKWKFFILIYVFDYANKRPNSANKRPDSGLIFRGQATLNILILPC